MSFSPLPPHYDEVTGQTDIKTGEQPSYGHSPWLLRRTSIRVESTPNEAYYDDRSSNRDPSIKSNDEKGAIRNLMTRFGSRQGEELIEEGKSFMSQGQDQYEFGTKVSIEASNPLKAQTRQRHEMKGLEQAASVKRWPGGGSPAEAWGKLAKDPELWDPAGDTLVYYGYQRPQASFRVKSSVIEETKSDILLSLLEEGYKRTPKCSSQGRPAAPPVRGIKKLSLRSAPSIADMGSPEQEALICHEIHFPAPPDASGQELLRYHITTRNFFAFLLNKPLVGLTFYQALIDLHERLMTCMPKDADHTELMVRYLTRNRLHNVCNDPVAASGLLAWCEDEEVQWQEGWREGFVHCCGLYSRLRSLPEFRDISHVSRTLLERSSIEIEARIGCAAERLSNFNFDDMWPVHNTAQPHSARASFYHFRTFLVGFYEKSYKGWPPRCAQNTDGNWLSRSVVARLQKDFGALYDYYVDRDVVWSQMMGPSEQYRNFIRTTNGIHTKVSDDNLCLEKLFVQFDHKHKFPHIPHPYPILPISIQTNDAARQQQKQALFGSKTKAYEKRIVHAYSEASNALLLGPEVASNGLVEAYQKFERTDHLGEINPRDARKGRWILLYGILETLSTISADTPNLFFTNAVSYFLNPRLKGTPPWMTGKGSFFEEASPMVSHCWMISRSSWGNNIIAT